MWHELVTPKFLIVYPFVASATFTAPYNAVMYLFSAVPSTPIRDEAEERAKRYGQIAFDQPFRHALRPADGTIQSRPAL